MSKPSVFVGSSSEGLRVAREIQFKLADVGEVELWDEGVFALGFGALESLVQALNRFDFAVFVLTPDDLTVSRGAPQNSARDNVLIELGLFIGRLGDKNQLSPKEISWILPEKYCMLYMETCLSVSSSEMLTIHPIRD